MGKRTPFTLTVIAAASLAYSLFSVAADPPTTTTSSPCLPGDFTVNAYGCGFPAFPISFGANDTVQEDCDEVCRTFRGTCIGAVKTTKKCFNGVLGKAENVFNTECATLSDNDQRRNCRNFNRDEERCLKEYTKQNAKFAEGCCEDLFPICKQLCELNNLNQTAAQELFDQLCIDPGLTNDSLSPLCDFNESLVFDDPEICPIF